MIAIIGIVGILVLVGILLLLRSAGSVEPSPSGKERRRHSSQAAQAEGRAVEEPH